MRVGFLAVLLACTMLNPVARAQSRKPSVLHGPPSTIDNRKTRGYDPPTSFGATHFLPSVLPDFRREHSARCLDWA